MLHGIYLQRRRESVRDLIRRVLDYNQNVTPILLLHFEIKVNLFTQPCKYNEAHHNFVHQNDQINSVNRYYNKLLIYCFNNNIN